MFVLGAFVAQGENSVASNIMNQTYRIQYWDLNLGLPDLCDGKNLQFLFNLPASHELRKQIRKSPSPPDCYFNQPSSCRIDIFNI